MAWKDNGVPDFKGIVGNGNTRYRIGPAIRFGRGGGIKIIRQILNVVMVQTINRVNITRFREIKRRAASVKIINQVIKISLGETAVIVSIAADIFEIKRRQDIDNPPAVIVIGFTGTVTRISLTPCAPARASIRAGQREAPPPLRR